MRVKQVEPEIARLVISRRAYLDTVMVYLSEPVEPHLSRLKQLAGSAIEQLGLPRRSRQWPSGVLLHQPTAAVFAFIEETFTSHMVARFDVALDLQTRTKRDAELIEDFLEARLVSARQRKQFAWNYVMGTLYSDAKEARNVLVIYSDMASKLNSQPCCHIEWRTSSVPAVKAANVWKITDLCMLDLNSFFRGRLTLRELPSADEQLVRLGNCLLRQPKRKKPRIKMHIDGRRINVPLRLAMTVLRASATERGPSVANVLSRIGRRHARHFPVIATEWMLPEGALEFIPTSKDQVL